MAMTHKVKLFGTNHSYGPPQWWINFADTLEVHLSLEDTNSLVQRVCPEITFSTDVDGPPWGNRYLEFPSEAEYLMFVLKWS